MKTAIIGASSYIGKNLIDFYRLRYPDCVGTYFKNKKNLKNIFFDLKNSNINNLKLYERGHKSVIISAAIPNIDFCEKNPNLSYKINVEGTLKAINELVKTPIKIIFLSSDYVFDGKKGSYSESDITNPSTNYGKQKKKVEDEIINLSDKVIILRLSKVYGLKKGDGTLLDEAANLLSKKKYISAALDQFFCPIFIDDLVKIIDVVQNNEIFGKLNVCSDEVWSRYNLILKLAEEMKINKDYIKKINLHDFSNFNNRPLNTSMINKKLHKFINFKFFSMAEAVKKIAFNYENISRQSKN